MKALITGASSGLGLEMAKYLAKKKYELILVARNKERLQEIQNSLPTKTMIVAMDLREEQKIKELYVIAQSEDIDILINNAGFGKCALFKDIELKEELDMINTNIKAVHMLTKLFLKEMVKKDRGYILNVSSSAAFLPGGPLMSTYYATKSYIRSLTEGIWYELKKMDSKVSISCLLPGPTDTNFNKVANVMFSVKPMDKKIVAKYAIDEMFKKKLLIIPGYKMHLAKFFQRFCSDKMLLKIIYKIQKKKITKKKEKDTTISQNNL
ncbi:MAG: SDR family NAD(P)-dependent oxidoreductase [Bacilli bacterium]|nr:SDR family NAD(P)-dependent oxidoreductase [Bacilli bacterium]